jgi:pimeloyl-ACP methyl ester carboxylesterase
MVRLLANGIELHFEDHGAGRPILLLHGFPDSSQLWRHQIPALAAAGFRVLAPDMRGFGQSEKPAETHAYELGNAVADCLAILDRLDLDRVHVVGHDWGAAVAWLMALQAPERVDRLAVLSVGHPNTWAFPAIEARERSWYQLFFLFEGTAEAWLQHDDWRLFRDWLQGGGDAERYIEDLSRPGSLTAALSWYRANSKPAPPPLSPHPYPSAKCPTLAIWSSGDHYLTEDKVVGSKDHVDGPWRYERLEGVSHWIPLDAAQWLNALLLEWFG